LLREDNTGKDKLVARVKTRLGNNCGGNDSRAELFPRDVTAVFLICDVAGVDNSDCRLKLASELTLLAFGIIIPYQTDYNPSLNLTQSTSAYRQLQPLFT